jgi:hypothetical protein
MLGSTVIMTSGATCQGMNFKFEVRDDGNSLAIQPATMPVQAGLWEAHSLISVNSLIQALRGDSHIPTFNFLKLLLQSEIRSHMTPDKRVEKLERSHIPQIHKTESAVHKIQISGQKIEIRSHIPTLRAPIRLT